MNTKRESWPLWCCGPRCEVSWLEDVYILACRIPYPFP